MADLEKLYETLGKSIAGTLDRLVHEQARHAVVVERLRDRLEQRKTAPARERALERLREAEWPLQFVTRQLELMEVALAANEALWQEATAPPEEPVYPEGSLEAANALWEWLLTQDDATHDTTLYMPGEHDCVGDAEFILVSEGPGASRGRGPFAHVDDEHAMGEFLKPYGIYTKPGEHNTVIAFYRS